MTRTPLPTIVDRMPLDARKPKAGPLLEPGEVIALSLNAIPHEWWKRLPLSETSEPVLTVLDGLKRAGWKIEPR